MHCFYAPDLPPQPATVSLTDGEVAHAARVLRVQRGDTVTVLNGRGISAIARVVAVDRRRVELEVERIEQTPPPPFAITLFQAVTKPKSMEWIVQKATELGVHAIQPMITARVVPQGAEGGGSKKAAKWRRIAVEALKQCGQSWLPHIAAPACLTDLLVDAPPSFLASLQPGARPLREWLSARKDRFPSGQGSVVGLWIGPEGDFAPEETRALLAAGALPITLGPGVLRSETAALCGLALLNYELNLTATATEAGRGTTAQSGPDESVS